MKGIGLVVSVKWAKENWDKRGIYAYSNKTRNDWVITDVEELDNLTSDVIIYIDNE